MSFIDFLNKILGDPNEKELKKIRPIVEKVRKHQFSDEMKSLTLDKIPEKTEEYKKRISGGETLEDILPEAFALVCRTCELLQGKTMAIGQQEFTWDMVPYDVQIIGGVVLHKGAIAEMKTGEGKTLVCTMPVYLNALTGKGVHVVTVNDYLAKRDAAWMGMLYEALGLTVGVIVHEKTNEERALAYARDVTYGTNNEFGFDYLRDNMTTALSRQVQRGLHYAIVDEVDSILIDEARTPLIISQPGEESTQKYVQYSKLVQGLKENVHYNKDEKQRVATLTEEGIKQMENLLGVENIYTDKGFSEVHHIEQALRAHAIYKADVDYVVKEREIIIVDEFTGRLMPGRRFSHGLHQALEAKEKVPVQRESRTLATITFQNYFRLFEKLAGMTGTAKTEEEEFQSIYKLPVYCIPTNALVIRNDKSDAIYRTVQAKFMAVSRIAKERHEKGQPVLIGTTSIDKSEVLSMLLTEEKIPHEVLNAKHHEKEAEIVSKAGRKGAVTIATNMAGRGTDIKLEKGVADLGGLLILGTERHESRRIDNQLRGRSGRQGDPGESQFFVSMEDELMRLFGGDRLKGLMERLNVPDDIPLETGMVSRSIESAQKRVEGRNFDIRRHVVQYDDVMNKHRSIIYSRRQKILVRLAESENGDTKENQNDNGGSLHTDILNSLRKEAKNIVNAHAFSIDSEEWDIEEMREILSGLHPSFAELLNEDYLRSCENSSALEEYISDFIVSFYEEKCSKEDEKIVRQAERVVTLQSIDTHWMDHIDDMSNLREQVAFSGFAQRNPLIEYKDQGFRRFSQLLSNIDSTIVRTLLQADLKQFSPSILLEKNEEQYQTNDEQIISELQDTGVDKEAQRLQNSGSQNSDILAGGTSAKFGSRVKSGAPITANKIGRNDLCPCGSGKKYKKCHGK